MADGSADLFAKGSIVESAYVELKAAGWVTHYPTPKDIEQNAWAYVLCIDPNGIRTRGPRGPIYFLLDNAIVMPGLTDRSGSFTGYINDNQRRFSESHKDAGEVIHWDMYLLRDGETYIMDADEFWVGVQRGGELKMFSSSIFSIPPKPPSYRYEDLYCKGAIGDYHYRDLHAGGWIYESAFIGGYEEFVTYCSNHGRNRRFADFMWGKEPDILTSDNPADDPWYEGRGTDGKGLGRKWITGGYITKRYYNYEESTRITAIIRGKDYMDLWREQPFGTPDIPREYTTATDLATIAADVLTDVNITSGLGTLSPFTQSSTYWPGAGSIPAVTGTEWIKEFKQDWAMEVMMAACEEIGWEWRINHKKEVLFYPRSSAPEPVQPLIQYSRNIKSLPEICLGDTSELITHVVITDGSSFTLPEDIDKWCLNADDWPEVTNPNLSFSMTNFPFPPNTREHLFSDSTLTFDDEGHPALCFIKDTINSFDLALAFYRDSAGNKKFAELEMDLRKWRRVKFRLRHATRDPNYEYGGVSYTTGSRYRFLLKYDLSHGYQYEFGKGTANPLDQSPQLGNNLTDNDTITGRKFNDIDLLLPEPDVDGVISNANLKGWTRIGSYTGSTINWVELIVEPAEPDPGPINPFLATGLASSISSGDQYINLSNPEKLAGYLGGGSVRKEFTPGVEVIMKQGAKEETLFIKGINGQYYPSGKNTRLDTPAQNSFTTSAAAYVRVGWTIAFSQMRLERALRYDGEALSPLGPPYRYKLVTKKEMEYLNEATSNAAILLAQEASPKKYVELYIDDPDPNIEIGVKVRIFLDPGHSKVFQNVPMIVDDISYDLEGQVKLNQRLMLSPANENIKARLKTTATALDTLFRKTDNLGTPSAKRGAS